MLLIIILVTLINIPFGYWRSGTRKFSRAWFFHVHGSIPLVVMVRMMAGIHWTVMVGATLASSYFVGQNIGGRLRAKKAPQV